MARAPHRPTRPAAPARTPLSTVDAQATAADPSAAPPTAGTAQHATGYPTPDPTITLDEVREIARADLPKFRMYFRDCVSDSGGSCGHNQGFTDWQMLAQATVATPVPIVLFDESRLHTYAPGMRVAPLLTPVSSWLVPVVGHGEGRAAMVVSSYPDGKLSVVQWGGYNDASADLVQLQNRYAGTPVTITLILLDPWGPNLALVTDGEQESLVVLRPPFGVESPYPGPPPAVEFYYPGLQVEALEPLAVEHLMPRLVELYARADAACPPQEGTPPPEKRLVPCV